MITDVCARHVLSRLNNSKYISLYICMKGLVNELVFNLFQKKKHKRQSQNASLSSIPQDRVFQWVGGGLGSSWLEETAQGYPYISPSVEGDLDVYRK